MRFIIILCMAFTMVSCSREKSIDLKKSIMRAEADRRVQKVTDRLKADCDTSLLKETYRRVQQLRQSAIKPIEQRRGRRV